MYINVYTSVMYIYIYIHMYIYIYIYARPPPHDPPVGGAWGGGG